MENAGVWLATCLLSSCFLDQLEESVHASHALLTTCFFRAINY